MKKIILDLCGGTGQWSQPYKENGYDVRLITLPKYDVRTYEPPKNVYGILAAPPCTHFSKAGAQYWSYKDLIGETKIAIDIVNSCLRIIEKCNPNFWALENPPGRLKNYIGSPSYKFYQSDFGGKFKKLTYLWGNFNIFIVKGPINKNPINLESAKLSELYQLPKDYNLDIDHNKRAAQRSILCPGFAQAFYESNK